MLVCTTGHLAAHKPSWLLCNIIVQESDYIRCFLSLQKAIAFYTVDNVSWVDPGYSMQKC